MEHFVGPKYYFVLGLVVNVARPLEAVGECPQGHKDSPDKCSSRDLHGTQPKEVRDQRQGRPSLDQKDSRVGPVGGVGELPLEDRSHDRGGPDDGFDGIPQIVVPQHQFAHGRVEAGNPEKDGGKVELAGVLVGPLGLPLKGVEGPRDDQYRFDGKAKEKGR